MNKEKTITMMNVVDRDIASEEQLMQFKMTGLFSMSLMVRYAGSCLPRISATLFQLENRQVVLSKIALVSLHFQLFLLT